MFGCQPYLSEDRYREELARGRIRFADLQAVLRDDLGTARPTTVAPRATRLGLRLAMLQYPLRTGPTDELLWFVAETDALRRVRPEVSLAARAQLVAETRRWVMRDLRGAGKVHVPTLRTCSSSSATGESKTGGRRPGRRSPSRRCGGCAGPAPRSPRSLPVPPTPVRHRDLLLEVAGGDTDLLVHDVLIRFCGAFLDQGLAHWPLPERDEGFFPAFFALYRQPGRPPDRWRRGLAAELARLADREIDALRVDPRVAACSGRRGGRSRWDDVPVGDAARAARVGAG